VQSLLGVVTGGAVVIKRYRADLLAGAHATLLAATRSWRLIRGGPAGATARAPERLVDLAEQHGERLWPAALDVTDTTAVRAVVDDAFAELGRIDVIVSNAGRGLFGAAEEVSDEDIAEQISLNLVGPGAADARGVATPAYAGRREDRAGVHDGRPVRLPGRQPLPRVEVGRRRVFESIAGEVAPSASRSPSWSQGPHRPASGAHWSSRTHSTPTPTRPSAARRYIESAGDLTAGAPGDPDKSPTPSSRRSTSRRLLVG
jgi:NAD(P)-dependent dehydrogenase (short-subunit alcohol dehydrogenase family)